MSKEPMPQELPVGLQSDRRRGPRFRESFPVKIDFRSSSESGRIRATAKDFNEGGVCARLDRPLPIGRGVEAGFILPDRVFPDFKGISCRFPAVVQDLRVCNPTREGGYEVVLKFPRPLSEMARERIESHRKMVTGIIILFILLTFWLKWASLRYFWYQPVLYSYNLFISFYFLTRFFISWTYKAPELTDYAPPVSICISVRNDEHAIARCIETCYEADYPEGRREVICVDDGSTDGTPAVLQQVKLRHPDLKLARIAPAGKRHGMTTAIKQATGEIVVVVDSDTFLEKMALRHIVQGFQDPTLGAVSGHTDVDNVAKNMLTGLQQVRYYISFKLLKTCESIFGCVTCCPGCLSAYRREYLAKIVDPWLNQTFMGAPATFGDDRSLTNYILRDYRVTYNDKSICTTISPETWMHYLRQQVRWKKSWLRETLIASGFMWRKHPVAAITFYLAAVVSLMSPFMAYRALYLAVTRPDAQYLYYVSGLVLYGFCQSIYYLYRQANSRWLLGMVMIASHVLVLGPQTYYAILTMRKNHWGTR